jgi:hypothetical protein
MTKLSLLLLMISIGCDAPAPTTTNTTPARPGIACGEKLCAATDTCIATHGGPGTPPPAGMPAGEYTDFTCEAQPHPFDPQPSSGMSCGAPDRGVQHCIVEAPSAPRG